MLFRMKRAARMRPIDLALYGTNRAGKGRPLVIPVHKRNNAVVCYIPVQDRFVTLLWTQLESR